MRSRQYRIFFMDALRRVTGRDLFREYERFMNGRIALAAVVGIKRPGYNEEHQSILFGPSYGQLDYWFPVLLYLAREYRRPIYQHLALWDRSLGAIQKTRYVTSNGKQLLFEMGGYAYAWYDPTVPDRIEEHLPISFEFPDVNEVYARSSYEAGAIVVGMKVGRLGVHAGGRPVLIDLYDVHHEPKPAGDLTLRDDRSNAVIHCSGIPNSGFAEQRIELERPDRLTICRKGSADVPWWCHGEPTQDRNTLTWPEGTVLRVTKGRILSLDPEGHRDEKIVGLGKLKLVDPMPISYPLIIVRPLEGELAIEVRIRESRE